MKRLARGLAGAAGLGALIATLVYPSRGHGEPSTLVARISAPPARERNAPPIAAPIAAELRAAGRGAPTPGTGEAAVEYEAWHGTSFGAYLAPKGEFWADDGGVDVIVHFNAAMLAGRSWQTSHAKALVVSASFGTFGSGAYQEAMADPGRFGRMLAEVIATVESQKKLGKRLHVRRLGIVAWSAGFGAVGRILAVPRYFEQIDSVILLDALQAGYKDPARGTAQGAEQVSLTGLAPYIRFAREAQAGRKQLVVTHTSIVPPQYASTTDAALALVAAVSAEKRESSELNARSMTRKYRVDAGELHVHGYRGAGPDDHMKHLHLVGDVVHEFLVPRWTR